MLKKMIHRGAIVRDLTKLRRRAEQESLKHIGFMSKVTTLHVHHSFSYISLVTARLRRENA